MVQSDVLDPEGIYYVSGPMTGIDQYNYPYFNLVSTRLRYLGLEVRSPSEIPTPPTELKDMDLWKWCMDRCMSLMEGCDNIVLLRGWPKSSGARKELEYALANDFTVHFYADPPGKLVNMSRRLNV